MHTTPGQGITGVLVGALGKGSPPYWKEMHERRCLSSSLDAMIAARDAGNDSISCGCRWQNRGHKRASELPKLCPGLLHIGDYKSWGLQPLAVDFSPPCSQMLPRLCLFFLLFASPLFSLLKLLPAQDGPSPAHSLMQSISCTSGTQARMVFSTQWMLNKCCWNSYK